MVKQSVQACQTIIGSLEQQADVIASIADRMVAVLQSGGKVLSAGNGGSAAEAMHLAEELVGRYRGDRVSLPGLSLVADSTALTCIANDYGYERVFSRQIEGLGRAGDMLVLFSTSGKSENMVQAVFAGTDAGMITVNLLGGSGGSLAGKGDYEVIVDSDDSARVQEAHQLIMHILLEAVEQEYAS